MLASLRGEELDVELLAFLGLEDPSGLLVSHWRQLGATVFLFWLTIFRGSVRGNLLFIVLGELILRNGSPDGELSDWGSLRSRRWLLLDRVDQGRGQRFVIGIGPLGLRNHLFDIFAEENEVILDVLLSDDSLSVGDLLFRCFCFFITLALCFTFRLLSRFSGLRLIFTFFLSCSIF